MNLSLLAIALVAAATAADAENPIFKELVEHGVKASDGTAYKLLPPIMADGLDAAGQRAALKAVADAKNPVESLLQKSYYAPVVTKVRTLKAAEATGPTVRAVDVWFVAHGDWKKLTSKDFLESMAAGEGKSQVVTKSGALTDAEMKKRNLAITSREGYEERFLYTTFSLFEQVEVSSTRLAAALTKPGSVLAAGRVDPRFDADKEFPNCWRALSRDAQANITPGKPQPLGHAGGYAKITRLIEPADGVFIEAHLIFEEPYGWFEGVNLVKQKAPAMVREKVRSFRRKLLQADEKPGKK